MSTKSRTSAAAASIQAKKPSKRGIFSRLHRFQRGEITKAPNFSRFNKTERGEGAEKYQASTRQKNELFDEIIHCERKREEGSEKETEREREMSEGRREEEAKLLTLNPRRQKLGKKLQKKVATYCRRILA